MLESFPSGRRMGILWNWVMRQIEKNEWIVHPIRYWDFYIPAPKERLY